MSSQLASLWRASAAFLAIVCTGERSPVWAFCYPWLLSCSPTSRRIPLTVTLLSSASQRDGTTRSLDRKNLAELVTCPNGCPLQESTGRGQPASSAYSVRARDQPIKSSLHKHWDLQHLSEKPGVAGCSQEKTNVKFRNSKTSLETRTLPEARQRPLGPGWTDSRESHRV